ncbi:MAG: F0F1 ATP synthase subunit B [Actinobacteria bacterium]|nr:F0F1 ATP synthase subunit B [Actinomycetota bacterium]
MRTRRTGAAVALVFVALLASTGVASAVEGAPPPAPEGAPAPPPGAPPAPPPEAPEKSAEECIHLLEEGGKIDDCQEAPNPILPELPELIWGTISFVLLLVLLSKLAFPALKKSMQARSDKIRDSLDEAERARSEAQGVLAAYQRQLDEAKAESGRILDEARQSADSVKADLLARAEAEAQEQRRRNAEQIAAERDRVMSELQSQVAVLAIEMAERVVESSLDRDANMRLIENYINTVGNGSGNGSRAGGADDADGTDDDAGDEADEAAGAGAGAGAQRPGEGAGSPA